MNNKVFLWLKGCYSCFSWMFKAIWDEYLIDLHLHKIPSHPNDYIAFAERWNGRVAMISIIVILQWELLKKQASWS